MRVCMVCEEQQQQQQVIRLRLAANSASASGRVIFLTAGSWPSRSEDNGAGVFASRPTGQWSEWGSCVCVCVCVTHLHSYNTKELHIFFSLKKIKMKH